MVRNISDLLNVNGNALTNMICNNGGSLMENGFNRTCLCPPLAYGDNCEQLCYIRAWQMYTMDCICNNGDFKCHTAAAKSLTAGLTFLVILICFVCLPFIACFCADRWNLVKRTKRTTQRHRDRMRRYDVEQERRRNNRLYREDQHIPLNSRLSPTSLVDLAASGPESLVIYLGDLQLPIEGPMVCRNNTPLVHQSNRIVRTGRWQQQVILTRMTRFGSDVSCELTQKCDKPPGYDSLERDSLPSYSQALQFESSQETDKDQGSL